MKDYQNPSEDYSFKPVYTADLTNRLLQNYKQNPQKFNDNLVSQLESHAKHYNINFNRDEQYEDFDLLNTVKQVGTGFVSGFTTLNYGEPPKNPYENIANSLGHLLGFVGWVPGASAKSGIAAMRALALLKNRSLPMLVAGKLTKPASELGSKMVSAAVGKRGEAGSLASKLLYNDTARDAVEGAFHLGAASAVSSWTYGVDAMVDSAVHGGIAGGAFRGIGNLLKSPIPTENKLAEDALGSIAGALFQGLPSTIRGATAPEQIYEYLLGAYFGFNESPSSRRTALKYRYEELGKEPTPDAMEAKLQKDLATKDWSPETKTVVEKYARMTTQNLQSDPQVQTMMRDLIKTYGEDHPDIKKTLEEGFRAKEGRYPTEQELKREAEFYKQEESIETRVEKIEEKAKEENVEANDPGISIDVPESLKRWSDTRLDYLWKNEQGIEDLNTKKVVVESLNKKLADKVKNKDMDVNEMTEWLKRELNYNVDDFPEAGERNFFRNYLKRRVQEKNIPIMSPTIEYDTKPVGTIGRFQVGTISGIKNYSGIELTGFNPQNAAGNRKSIKGEIYDIENVYNELTGNKIDFENNKQRPIRRIDDLVWTDGGVKKQGSLLKYMDFVERRNYDTYREIGIKEVEAKNLSRKDAEVEYNRLVGTIHEDMNTKGFYDYSGRGDQDVMNYVRFHPNASKKKSKSIVNQYAIANKIPLKKIAEERKRYINNYKGEIKNPGQLFDRSFASNILYELSLNGFDPVRKNYGIIKDLANKGDSFITNPIAFNKRQQINLTNAVPLEAEFITNSVPDVIDGNLKTIILKTVDDLPSNLRKKPWERNNVDYIESDDGGSLTRRDVLNAFNAEQGQYYANNPSGHHKNFAVSRAKDQGLLLVKHESKDAGTLLSKAMQDLGIHQMYTTTGAKQYGTRKPVFAELVNNKLEFFDYVNGKKTPVDYKNYMFDVNAKDIRTVMSETASESMIKDKRMIKQLPANLSPLNKGFTPEIAESWFNDYNLRGFNGTSEYNAKLDKYLTTKNEKMIDDLVFNMEKISTPKVLEVISTPGNTKLQVRFYEKMLDIAKESDRLDLQGGTTSVERFAEATKDLNDFRSVTDRNLRLAENNIAVILAKPNNKYRETVLKKYLVHQITRPVVPNSFSGKLDIFDLELQQNPITKRLNTEKDVILLHDGNKKKPINYDDLPTTYKDGSVIGKGVLDLIKRNKTLGELWDYRNSANPKTKEIIDNFVEQIVVRVPLDSTSGAVVLKFKGFTGRQGFGGIVHSEAMGKLGGADSDGDKFISYMNAKSKYKKLIKENADEFVRYYKKSEYDSGKIKTELTAEEFAKVKNKDDYYPAVMDNKRKHRSKFTLTKEEVGGPDRTDSDLIHSPLHRREISNTAAEGRNSLGPAVVNKQNLISAYTDMPNTIEYSAGGQNPKWEFTISKKNSPKEIAEAKEILRTSIAIPSDPLDEIGIKRREAYYSSMFDSLFKVDIYLKNGKPQSTRPEKIPNWIKFKVISPYSKLNSIIYGKNYMTGKQWNYAEYRNGLDVANQMGIGNQSAIGKIGKELTKVHFNDGLRKRVNTNEVVEAYKKYDANQKQYYDVAKAIGRAGFPIRLNPATNDIFFNHRNLDVLNKDGKLFKAKYENSQNEVKFGEELFSNDLHNMAGFNAFIKYWKDVPGAKLKEMGNKVKEISDRSLEYRLDAEDAMIYKIKFNNQVMEGINKRVLDNLEAKAQAKNVPFEILSQSTREKTSSMYTQREIDADIAKYKAKLNDTEKMAFDGLLLSGFKTGMHNKVDRFYDLLNKRNMLTDKELVEFESLKDDVYHTSAGNLGFASRSVSDAAIKEFWSEYNKSFDSMTKPMTEGLKSEIDDVAKNITKTEVEIDKAKQEVDLNETYESKLSRLRTLDKIPGFRRLFENEKLGKVKLTNENQRLLDELNQNLGEYGNSIGIKLEGLIRDLFQKSPDALTIEEVRSFNELLKTRKSGKSLGWLQRRFTKWMNGDPKLNGYFYHQFPRTVDKAWLKNDMQLVERIGWYFEPGKKLPSEGIIFEPSHVIGQSQFATSNLGDMASDVKRQIENRVRDNLKYLNSIKEGPELHELAVYIRELPEGIRLYEAKDYASATAYGVRNGKLEPKISKRVQELGNKKFAILEGAKRKEMTGYEIIDKINKFWDKELSDTYKNWIKSNEKDIANFVSMEKDGREKADVNKFVVSIMDAIKENKPVHEAIKIGGDGMRRMSIFTQMQLARNPEAKIALSKKLSSTETPYRKYYWPHRNYDPAVIEKVLKERMQKLKETPLNQEADREAIINEAANLAFRMKTVSDDYNLDVYKDWSLFEQVSSKVKEKSKDKLRYETANIRSGHTQSRDLHISGYDRSPTAAENYIKSIVDSYYQNATQIINRKIIDQFELTHLKKYTNKDGSIKDKDGYDNIKAWTDFFKLYANRSMGYPEAIPDYIANNPKMKIKGTPYHWFADSTVKNRINKISEKLGLKKNELPPELDEALSYRKLRNWTNMEAKFQLATLLAHPKTAVANIFGGSTMTIQSTGIRHWNKVRDIDWLKTNINETFTSKQKIYDWVESLGVVEEFLRKEIGLTGAARNKKVSDGLEKLIKKIKNDPEVSDKTLKKIWRESGLSDSLFEKGAYFMRISERKLRKDAFMAHYLQAVDIFKGAITDPKHPFLIWWAKRGVKDTQFLYNAASRPAFASSALGKVMSRFQLWAANSVAFRRMVYTEAKERGFARGTREYKRLERTLQIDMMLFALANTFAYSLFENTLPAPLNWFQDLSDWMFGDEKERDRAFFGAYPSTIAPLQMVTPPALRLLPPTIKGLVDDDWGRMSEYYLWTMIPFGRLARDVKISVENPMQIVERTTGFPYVNLHRYLKGQRDETPPGEG